jgi:ribosome-binding ATPase YchF (GTP1/OBG family)
MKVISQRLATTLQEDRPLRDENIGALDRELLQGYGLLTNKPLLLIQNLEEGNNPLPIATDLPSFAMYGKLEAELVQLPAEEAAGFRREFGIKQAGSEGLLTASLDLLQQIRFYTVSESEVRAWPLLKGSTALQAAGVIHSDMARGFIRAETIQWGELIALGGLSERCRKIARRRKRVHATRWRSDSYPLQCVIVRKSLTRIYRLKKERANAK